MKIRFLGTGSSGGVPEIGCDCEVCTSTNPKDKRSRSSVLVSEPLTGEENLNVLVDVSPDFRTQMLNMNFKEGFENILITHPHNDHISGFDDLKYITKITKRDMEVFADQYTANAIRISYDYMFNEQKIKDYPYFLPSVNMHIVERYKTFFIKDKIEVQPLPVMHGNEEILGYKIGKTVYISDCSFIPPKTLEHMHGLDLLVLDCTHYIKKTSILHFTLEECLNIVEQVKPKQTYLTHMSHHCGVHDAINRAIKEQTKYSVELAYDGLEVEV